MKTSIVASYMPVIVLATLPLTLRAGRLPLVFERNLGQTGAHVDFIARGAGYGLYLSPAEFVFDTRTTAGKEATVRAVFLGAERVRRGIASQPLPGKVNYFIGNDRRKWRTNIPTFGRVKYPAIYPGIDVVYYGRQNQLEYDFIVAPHANPTDIRFQLAGAREVRLNPEGDLLIETAAGTVRQHRPVAYQDIQGRRQAVRVSYNLLPENKVELQVGNYDKTSTLVIDPVLVYSTYLGGTGDDTITGIAVGSAHRAYVTGFTSSLRFPAGYSAGSPDGFPANFGKFAPNVFVAKLNDQGTGLVYFTVFGGESADFANAIAVDVFGNAYIAGQTSSTPAHFPEVNPLPRAQQGSAATTNAFITKLNPAGSRILYSTLLGSSGDDFATGIAIDSRAQPDLVAGAADSSADRISAYVTGSTTPSFTNFNGDFPTTGGAFQTRFGGAGTNTGGRSNAFIAKLSPNGGRLVYSTYLGGNSVDNALRIAVDSNKNALVAGTATSPDFPVRNAFQATLNGPADAFVSKLNSDGSALVFSTYLGGEDQDFGHGITVDDANNVYATGYTFSFAFPVLKAFQTQLNGINLDAFVTKFGPAGALLYSTYLGGTGNDQGFDIDVDSNRGAIVVGTTDSTDFPIIGSGPAPPSGTHAFVARIDPSGSFLAGSQVIGGSGNENGNAIAVDAAGNAYAAGDTTSADFPVTRGALDVHLSSQDTFNTDAWVSQIAFTSINSDFNNTAIPAGRRIWFNTSINVTGATNPTVIRFANSIIQFIANGHLYNLSVPKGEIRFTASGCATSNFDTSTGTWVIHAPVTSNEVFVSGLSFTVPTTFPGGVGPVMWVGNFTTNTEVTINWKWSAAVYTSFPADFTGYNTIGVKTTSDVNSCSYSNSDRAGTPELFKSFVTAGAKGAGGTNYTGNASAMVAVTPGPPQ